MNEIEIVASAIRRYLLEHPDPPLADTTMSAGEAAKYYAQHPQVLRSWEIVRDAAQTYMRECH